MSDWIVVKLGGTSQCKKGYDELIKMICANQKCRFVVVLSAISGVTDLLEKFTHIKDIKYLTKIYDKELHLRTTLGLFHDPPINYCGKDQFLTASDDDKLYEQSRMIGYGETISTQILHDYMKKEIPDEKIMLLSSYDFIKSKKETFKLYPSTEFYGDLDKFNMSCRDESYDDPRVMICQGFIASTPSNKTILLGRGGSDTTGAIIANMLSAQEYQVWTDVNGIYSCDPRIVDNPQKIRTISYEMAVEIAEMGAKVMHPFSILPCAAKNIPIKVKNTFNIHSGETIIQKTDSQPIIIAVQKNITLFKISSLDMWNSYGFMHDIFRKFTENKVDVNIVTTSPSSVHTTTDETDKIILKSLECELMEKYDVEMITDCSIVSIVSQDVRSHISKINLNDFTPHIIHFGANDLSINFVMHTKSAIDAANLYYRTLIK